MKKIFIVIVIIIFIGLLVILFKPKSEYFEGIVYDCVTNEPVPYARVQINTGNDIFNFFSDSGQDSEGFSDKNGNFSIKYSGGGGNVNVLKLDQYLLAQGTFLKGKVKIGLQKKEGTDKTSDYTTLCKRSSECVHTIIVNGYTGYENSCDMILPNI